MYLVLYNTRPYALELRVCLLASIIALAIFLGFIKLVGLKLSLKVSNLAEKHEVAHNIE